MSQGDVLHCARVSASEGMSEMQRESSHSTAGLPYQAPTMIRATMKRREESVEEEEEEEEE